MSRARAPGKLLLSGAYAVLSGAPALVTAVDRYVLSDSLRAATFLTPEVHAALGDRPAPWFDASALRDAGKKLGLGSSAAILVASLAALELDREPGLDDQTLCSRIYEPARLAHRIAEFAGRQPLSHRARMAAQAEAAEAALDAALRGDAAAFVAAIAEQVTALSALGEAAGVAIVTPELGELARLARAHAAAFLPAGAGGGDVAYYVGPRPPPAVFGARCRELGLAPVALGLAAPGVHACG